MTEIKHSTFGSSKGHSKEKQNPQQQIKEADLGSLIELGCIKEDVVIGNLSFKMRSLSSTERLMAADYIDEYADVEKLFSFNKMILSMAIDSVNGTPLENFYDGPDNLDVLSKRMEVMGKLQSPVIAVLLEAYDKITDRCDAQFNVEQVKK